MTTAIMKSLHGRELGIDVNGNLVIAKGSISPETGTATATAGAATLAKVAGKITSEALTTAAAGVYTLTITNTEIAAADIVLASVANGTNTQGTTVVKSVKPAANSVVIVVSNSHASEALNGTIVISFLVIKV